MPSTLCLYKNYNLNVFYQLLFLSVICGHLLTAINCKEIKKISHARAFPVLTLNSVWIHQKEPYQLIDNTFVQKYWYFFFMLGNCPESNILFVTFMKLQITTMEFFKCYHVLKSKSSYSSVLSASLHSCSSILIMTKPK